MYLHLTLQGAQAHLENHRLRVTHQGQEVAVVPLGQIQGVVLWGRVHLTQPLLVALLERGIPVVFLTQHGRYRGRLQGPQTPHVALRRAQYRRLEDEDWVLETARGLVQAKLQHQQALLHRYRRRHRLQDPTLEQVLESFQTTIAALSRKRTLNALRGAEGMATRQYFRGFRVLVQDPWRFPGRRRRPPTDPVNALLSLGYTLLTQKAVAAVETVGLDPYAGILHQERHGRPALALDLAEEFRPVVDGVVLKILHQGVLTPEDFQPHDDGGLRLRREALRRFLNVFEGRFAQRFRHPLRDQHLTLNQCLVEQAHQLARRIRQGEAGYQGMGFR